MKLLLKRIYNCKDYCIGHLYVDGIFVCDTIEDVDRGLDNSMSLTEILNKKVKHETAIPTGTYDILMNVVSPKYSNSAYYLLICKGKVPRLDNVKGYSGVLIHTGNTAADSSGCIIVGYNKVKGKVINSKVAFEKLYAILNAANNRGETITITIDRTYN